MGQGVAAQAGEGEGEGQLEKAEISRCCLSYPPHCLSCPSHCCCSAGLSWPAQDGNNARCEGGVQKGRDVREALQSSTCARNKAACRHLRKLHAVT